MEDAERVYFDFCTVVLEKIFCESKVLFNKRFHDFMLSCLISNRLDVCITFAGDEHPVNAFVGVNVKIYDIDKGLVDEKVFSFKDILGFIGTKNKVCAAVVPCIKWYDDCLDWHLTNLYNNDYKKIRETVEEYLVYYKDHYHDKERQDRKDRINRLVEAIVDVKDDES
jgi:hypothetical protein